jgi:ABC-type Fe3+-hydroxamate transport system substrate-binding protein
VRIACLVPSITELLCDLGLASQIVARTGYCIHPCAAVANIAKIGGTKTVNQAKLRKLAPTHLIVNIDENERPTADALRQFVPHVIVTHPCAPEDNLALYRLLGGIFNREQAAEALGARLAVALNNARAVGLNMPPRKVLYLIWREPWMTVAPDTYIARMLATIGWTTLPSAALGQNGSAETAGAARYPHCDFAAPWLREVDTVLLSSEPYHFNATHVRALQADPRLAGKTVRLIDGEMVSWYGSRAIAGLDYLANLA